MLPYGNGFLISGVNFYNFDGVECAGFEFARVIGTCIVYCGGFTYHTKGLQWENSVNKVSGVLLSQSVGGGWGGQGKRKRRICFFFKEIL